MMYTTYCTSQNELLHAKYHCANCDTLTDRSDVCGRCKISTYCSEICRWVHEPHHQKKCLKNICQLMNHGVAKCYLQLEKTLNKMRHLDLHSMASTQDAILSVLKLEKYALELELNYLRARLVASRIS